MQPLQVISLSWHDIYPLFIINSILYLMFVETVLIAIIEERRQLWNRWEVTEYHNNLDNLQCILGTTVEIIFSKSAYVIICYY